MSWAESDKYLAGSADVSVKVNKLVPTISVGDIGSIDADESVSVVASVDSGAELTYVTNDSSVASVSGNVVTGVIGGKVNITVRAAETDEYLAGSKNITITVNKISPNIKVDPFDVDADSTKQIVPVKPGDYSGEITYESNNTSIASVEGDEVTGIFGGKVNITVSWTETEKYTAGSSNVIVVVNKISPNLHADALDVEFNHTKSLVVTSDSEGGLTYEIQDSSIATVDGTGKVTSNKIGQTTVKISIAETEKYTSDEVDVIVNVIKTSPNLHTDVIRVKVGNTEEIQLTYLGNGTLSFESLDNATVTVSNNGKVTGIDNGETKVKITIAESENYTSQTIEVPVIVTNKEIGKINISSNQKYMVDVDGKIIINATTNSDGTLSYTINDTSVAVLSGNELTGLIGGKVKVTVTLPTTHDYVGEVKNITITVNKLTPTVTIINGENDEVDVGKNITVNAQTSADDMGDAKLIFESNDTDVAKIDENGVVTGLKGGVVNITVTSPETSRYSKGIKNITVTVNKLESNITVNNGEPVSVDVDRTVNVNATTNSNATVEFISANVDIAKIDSEGNLTGVTGYDVVITISVPENEWYLAKTVYVTVKVNKLTPNITINDIDSINADQTAVIVATTDSDGEKSYEINDTTVAALNGNELTGILGGKVNVTVNVAETDRYVAGNQSIEITVNKISPKINASDIEVDVDSTKAIDVKKPDDYEGIITFTSSVPENATVDANGNVTGILGSNQTVTISWSETDKYTSGSYYVNVIVNKLKPTLEVAKDSVSVDVDKSISIGYDYIGEGAVIFASSNTSVATVKGGTVTGIIGGEVTITLTSKETPRYQSVSRNVTVTVNKLTPEFTVNNEEPISIDVYGSVDLNVTTNSDGSLSFEIVDDSIADLNDVTVTGKKGGKVNVTVRVSETERYLAGSKNVTVTVNKLIPNIKILNDPFSVDVDDTADIMVDFSGDERGVSYKSNNESIAVIVNNNHVSGIIGGQVNITVTVGEDEIYEKYSKNFTLTVNKLAPTITVNGEPISVNVKDGVSIIVSVDSPGDVTFKVNDSSIATVNNDGLVEGLNSGIVEITISVAGTDKYLAANKTINVTVNKAPTVINVVSPIQTQYNDTISLNPGISTQNGHDVSEGNITYYIGENPISDAISIGDEFRWTVKSIEEFNITVKYSGSHNYLPSEANITVKSKKATVNVVVEVEDAVYPNAITVKVTSDVDGKYTVILNDTQNTKLTVDVVGGVGENTTFLNAGNYSAEVSAFDYENYTVNAQNDTFKIEKADINVTIVVDEIVYGSNVTGYITTDVAGTYTVNIADKYSFDIEVSEPDKEIYFNEYVYLDVDSYNATVATPEQENYNRQKNSTAFKVIKADNHIEVSVIPSTYPFNVTVQVTATAAGMYKVDINGTVVEVQANTTGTSIHLAAGSYYANITGYTSNNYNGLTKNTTFNVIRALAVIVIEIDDTTLPGDVFVKVISNMPDTYNITINGTYTVPVTVDEYGEGNATVSLPAGIGYVATTTFADIQNYTVKITEVKFNVSKSDNNIIVVVENIDYPNNATVRVIADVNGTYTVDINGTVVDVEANGEGKHVSLDVGSYNANVVGYVSDDYNAIITNDTFTVFGTNNVKVEVPEIVYNGEATINVTADVDGNYTVKINDENVTVEVINGKGSTTIELPEGSYATSTSLGDEVYHNDVDESAFYVLPKDIKYELTIRDINYPENDTITLIGEGNVTISVEYYLVKFFNTTGYSFDVYVNGVPSMIGEPVQKQFTNVKDIIISKTSKVNITVVYKDIVNNITVTSNALTYDITVKNSTVSAVADDISYTDNAIINIKAGEDGTYDVIVNGKSYEVNVTDGVGSLDLGVLPAGEYDVSIASRDNASIRNVTSFTISKADDIELNTSVFNEELTITNSNNATGKLTISVNGTDYEVELVNGTAKTPVDLYPGEYQATINYAGDENYNPVSKNITLTVPKIEVPFDEAVEIEVVNDTTSAEVTVKLPGDATGELIVTIDGVEMPPVEVVNGTATVRTDDLAIGNHTVSASYSGDGKYAPIENTTTLTVPKIPTPIEDAVSVEIPEGTTSAKITVKLPEFASGDVNITVDGKQYTAPINGGVATVTVDDMAVGEHNLTVNYPGDYRYEAANTNSTFDVPKVVLPADKTIKIDLPVNTTSPVVTVTLPRDATGKVTVTVDGENYTADVVNGTASVDVGDLAIGNHTVTATYSGDDKYAPVTKNSTVNIPKVTPSKEDLSVDVTLPVGDKDPVLDIGVPSDATGYVLVDINGYTYHLPIENGVSHINLPDLSYGKHNATITYPGDAKYNPISKNVTINIPKPKLSTLDITIRYTHNYIYKVRVTLDGKPIVKQYVTFKFAGKTYKRLTDEKGIVSLKLPTVKPNTYKIYATYKDVTISKNIKVVSIIHAKNKVAKTTSKRIIIKVLLKSVNKKYMSGKIVSMKFLGKVYKAKTNSKGIALFTFKNVVPKLKVNKPYKFLVTYGQDKLTRTVVVRR
ncbi:Ig-like domain repeat protein [uncultured Methanobrevibacter sp.]|uniref:Ig-like domain repeat protein n=1 Tax=uncultured Methanobrevibacter sp. TaxID=253161 RepID=UPI0025D8F0F4|nr:Ig-like domain repeat protein [uncultured Methanobrevibacter sp.]